MNIYIGSWFQILFSPWSGDCVTFQLAMNRNTMANGCGGGKFVFSWQPGMTEKDKEKTGWGNYIVFMDVPSRSHSFLINHTSQIPTIFTYQVMIP